MYKTAIILYLATFGIYLLFTRQPAYFEADYSKGIVVAKNGLDTSVLHKFHLAPNGNPIIKFIEGSETYYFNSEKYFLQSALQPGQRVEVIFDPGDLSKANVYSFWGYWIEPSELLTSLFGFALLFGIARGITGKSTDQNKEEEKRKERLAKYN